MRTLIELGWRGGSVITLLVSAICVSRFCCLSTVEVDVVVAFLLIMELRSCWALARVTAPAIQSIPHSTRRVSFPFFMSVIPFHGPMIDVVGAELAA
jgi:hypothetical protein